MLYRSLRGVLFFLVAVSLLSLGFRAQTLTDKAYLEDNAPALVTGSIYTQPVDPEASFSNLPGWTRTAAITISTSGIILQFKQISPLLKSTGPADTTRPSSARAARCLTLA